MKRAILTNRIYIDTYPELTEQLDKRLTYIIPATHRMGKDTRIKQLSRISKNVASFPVGRTDLIPEDYEIIDRRIDDYIDWPDPKFELRPSQKVVYDEVEGSCCINAPVSWGKTFTALHIAHKLSCKTLIITHTTILRDQWISEIKNLFGITPGVIGGGKFNLDGPIVVANVQSLIKVVGQLKDLFGTVVLDEAHHVPATTFSTCIDRLNARHKIGLTGTLERKDGRHIVFRDYFGSHRIIPIAENYMIPKVLIVKSKIPFVAGNVMEGDNKTWAHRVTDLCNNPDYRKLVTNLARSAEEAGHKVLIVSDRTDLLKACAAMHGESAIYSIGESKPHERTAAHEGIIDGKYKALYGAVNMYSEGTSLPPLSCLILGVHTNNIPLLRQLIGRVVRLHPNKPTPLIIDINLRGGVAISQANTRLGHYVQSGYDISFTETS